MTRRLAREEMSWFERAHARRLGLGPYYAAAVTLVVGHLAWPLFDAWQTQVGLGLMVLLCLMYIFSRLVGWTHILYGLLCLGMAGAWIYWLQTVGTGEPFWRPLPAEGWFDDVVKQWFMVMFWWAVGTHLLGVFWWSSKLKRTEVHLEDDLRGWQEIAGNFGLGMTKRHISKTDPGGNESGFLVWPRGTATVQQVLDKREQLEGAMGLQQGTLRLMKHGRDTNRVDYVSFADDPLTEAIEWPGPQQAEDGGDLSVDVPCAVGPQEDHQVGLVPYYDRKINAVVNKLLGGSQGSGKSGALNLHMMDIACRSDGTQWGIDLKDGQEIAPVDRILDNLATNAEQAGEMLEALDGIMTYRGEENTRSGRKAWPVSPEMPLLFVWIDELHRLLGAQNGRDGRQMRRHEEILVRAATTGRALGIAVNGATQNPTLEATRTSQFRDRLNQRICFRTESASHEGYIIPNRKVDAHLIPSAQPGMCYVQDRDKWTGMPVRYYLVTDPMMEMVMNIRAPGLPLDEGSRNAGVEAVNRFRATLQTQPTHESYGERCDRRYGDPEDGGASGEVSPGTGPDDSDGGATVTDISPEPVPELDLSGPDVTVAAIQRAHARLAGQGAAQPVPPVPVAAPAGAVPALANAARTVRERAADVPSGMEGVFAMLKLRGPAGATAKELQLAADRQRSWFHREKERFIVSGEIVQPEGRGGVYVLAEFAPVKH